MNETMTNEMVVARQDIAGVSLLDQFKDPAGNFYCSIADNGTRASKVAIFNAINGADENLADHINEVLEITHVVAHPVTLTDEETGEVITALRTVLIDKNGKAYQAVSGGVANALSRIISIIGEPKGDAWVKEPVKMRVKQVKTRNGNNKVNTIELV